MSTVYKLRNRLKQTKYKDEIRNLYMVYRKSLFNQLVTKIQKYCIIYRDKSLLQNEVDLLRKVNSHIYYKDEMYEFSGKHYFMVGLSAINCIDSVLSQVTSYKIKNILDMPSGCGRVLRFLIHRFPNATISSCDIDKDMVDYCITTFKVNGYYSRPDINNLSLNAKFSLIWCGSLVTHLDNEGIKALLDFFYRHMEPGGVLIFSTLGHYGLDRIKNCYEIYKLSKEGSHFMVQSYEKYGYAYLDYPGMKGYGATITSYSWVSEKIREVKGWQLIYFKERNWDNNQDIYGLIKQK